MPEWVESDNKMWPFFINCIGALNSLYILLDAQVKASKITEYQEELSD